MGSSYGSPWHVSKVGKFKIDSIISTSQSTPNALAGVLTQLGLLVPPNGPCKPQLACLEVPSIFGCVDVIHHISCCELDLHLHKAVTNHLPYSMFKLRYRQHQTTQI